MRGIRLEPVGIAFLPETTELIMATFNYLACLPNATPLVSVLLLVANGGIKLKKIKTFLEGKFIEGIKIRREKKADLM